jgi:putative transposase
MRFQVSKDTPAYYLTAVAKDRLPVFRTETIARLVCNAISESRNKHGFLIFAYVIMLDHLHLVSDSKFKPSELQRLINGIVGKRILDHLKANGPAASLAKLKIEERSDGSQFTVWQRHPDTRLLWNEDMLWQRIQYTHLNPVRAGSVEHPDDWKWSSARIFHGGPLPNEPLEVDLDKIDWRKT